MHARIGIIATGLFLASCAKDVSTGCPSLGANLAPGSVVDTITLTNGKQAVLTYAGQCLYDTVIIIDSIPDIVDSIPDNEDTIPIVEDTVRSVIMGFGSSTIARWDLQSAFPDKTLKKAGYKGTFISQLWELTDTIRKVKATQVLLYAGSNDVIAGKTTSEVTIAIQGLMRKIWDENLDVHITYITMHASDTAFKVKSGSNGQTGVQTIEYVNANIKKWITSNHSHHASVIDSYLSFLAWNPKRIETRYYEPDKLHLNQTDGYPKLNELTRPKLK